MARVLVLGTLLLVSANVVGVWGATWYVDGLVSASGDGKSWETAVKTIQEGIDLAFPADTVLVGSAGLPYFESAINFGRKAITVKSQDGPGVTIVDCGGTGWAGFIFRSGETGDSVLDGFTVRNGNLGVACYGGSSPTIKHCVLSQNGDGVACIGENDEPGILTCTIRDNKFGGITCDQGSRPAVTDCLIVKNGDYGIGLHNASNAVITGCTLLDNQGPGLRCWASSPVVRGSGLSGNEHAILCTDGSNPQITGSTLLGNVSSGIRCEASDPTIVSSLIFDNGAEVGGGIYCLNSNPAVVNCTVRGFSLEQGAEIFCSNSSPRITNTILWGDSERPMNWDPSSYPTVTYCAVRSGWLGEGNTDADPQFRDFRSGDLRLGVNSPCIDAGDNGAVTSTDTDVSGMHRILYGGKSLKVDIGAYEFHIWLPVVEPLTGDLILTWSSLAGKTYSVFRSADMPLWEPAGEDIPSAGDTVTTWIDSTARLLSPEVFRRYYRVREKE
jgi:hypothetical protein